MDLRQLRYFITIVEAGSISKAADRLRVAQPALSQHVRNMEQDLGVELLFRSPQGVKATEAGETLLRHARHILGQMDAAREEIRRGQFEPEGEVRLGMPGTVSQLLCVPLVTEARRLYPKIKLRVAEAMSGFVLDWLREGKIDVGVLYRSVSDRSFAVRPVLSEALCVLGPVTANAKPALPPGGPLSFAQVTELPLILPSASHGLRDLIEERALAQGVHVDPVIDLDSYAQIKLLVEGGVGYSILPDAVVGREVAEGRIRTWPLGEPQVTRDLNLVRLADRPQTNAMRAIEGLAAATFVRLVEEGTWPARLAQDGPKGEVASDLA